MDWNTADVALVARAATAVERAVPRGPVAVTVVTRGPAFYLATWSAEALGLRLESTGGDLASTVWPPPTPGLTEPPGERWPGVVVSLDGTQVLSVVRVR